MPHPTRWRSAAAELAVQLGYLLHRVVRGRDRRGDAVFGVGAQRLQILVTLLSVCARTCEPLSTTLRAAAESGLVTSVWTALVKFVNTELERARRIGIAIDRLKPLVEGGAQVRIGAARGFHPQLLLQIFVEFALDRGDADLLRRCCPRSK